MPRGKKSKYSDLERMSWHIALPRVLIKKIQIYSVTNDVNINDEVTEILAKKHMPELLDQVKK